MTAGRTADPVRDALERAVGEQYAVVRLLGRGGMGAVYLARESALERLVAIKVLPPDRSDDAERRERFKREARTAARLTHPNIVPLHTFGEAEGMMYFVMGYVQGESLAARLRREGRLSAEDGRRLLAEIAAALDYAHRQGVVHRDVKPENILIEDGSGRAVLTDFGVARASGAGTLTATGAILGTPHYMSPEQVSGGAVDGRSDLYSLGVTGFALLSGRLPFEAATPREVLTQVLTREPPSIRSVADHVPEDVALAVMRCLAREPGRRWPDGRSLAEALHARATGDEPEELEALEGWGGWIVVWTFAACCAAEVQLLQGAELGQMTIMTLRLLELSPLLLCLLVAAQAEPARLSGLGRSRIWKAVFLQPKWWNLWYPRSFRRPGDVWDRLPAPVRKGRLLLSAALGGFALGLPVLIAAMSILYLNRHRPPVSLKQSLIVILSAALGLLVAALVESFRWSREADRLGLDRFDRERIFKESTARVSFWNKPRIAAVLALPLRTRAVTEPRAAEEYLAAIDVEAEGLAGPLRDLATRAAAAARTVLSLAQDLERELSSLARDADPAEGGRIAQRLEAVGPATEGEPGERRRMRQLLGDQLELLRQVDDRREEVAIRRTRLLEHLRSLWREVRALREARPTGSEGETPARLRTLCEWIERQRTQGQEAAIPPEGLSTLTRDRG